MLAAEADIFQFQPPKFARTIEPQPASQTPQHTPQFPEPIHRPFNMTDLPRTIDSLPTQEQTDALQDMHTTTNQPHAHNLYQHEQHQQQLNQQTLQQQQNIQYIHIDQLNSPTYQNFGPQAAFGMNAPTTKSTRARSRTPSRAAAPETPQLQEPGTPALQQPADTPMLPLDSTAQQPSSVLPIQDAPIMPILLTRSFYLTMTS